jgi:hypothetical protein
MFKLTNRESRKKNKLNSELHDAQLTYRLRKMKKTIKFEEKNKYQVQVYVHVMNIT